MRDLLVERYLRFFANDDPDREVLRPGSTGPACLNVRDAITYLGALTGEAYPHPEDLFDDALREAVRRFQVTNGHRSPDGLVGPGTRSLITQHLLIRFGPSIFLRLRDPDPVKAPRVFLSYSTADTPTVEDLETWLQEHGVRVVRYTHSFQPGQMILDEARSSIATADKVLVIHSTSSIASDWVVAEVGLAEELERRLETPLLIYLCVDDTPLPRRDLNRIAILLAGRPVTGIGMELLNAIQA